jgi:hypothetical protein
VARNRALDLLRRDANYASRLEAIESLSRSVQDESSGDPFADDELRCYSLLRSCACARLRSHWR